MIFKQSSLWGYLSGIWDYYKDKTQHEAIWQTTSYIVIGLYLRLADFLNGRNIIDAPTGLVNTFLNSKIDYTNTNSGRTLDGTNVLSVSEFWSGTDMAKDQLLKVGLKNLNSEHIQWLPESYWVMDVGAVTNYLSFFEDLESDIVLPLKLSKNIISNELNFLIGEDGFSLITLDGSGDVQSRNKDLSEQVTCLVCDSDYVAVSTTAGKYRVFPFNDFSVEENVFDIYMTHIIKMFSGDYIFYCDDSFAVKKIDIGSLRSLKINTIETIIESDGVIISFFERKDIIYVIYDSVGLNVKTIQISNPETPIVSQIDNPFSPPADYHNCSIIECKYNETSNLVGIIWKNNDDVTQLRLVIYAFDSYDTPYKVDNFGVLSGTADHADLINSFDFFDYQYRVIGNFFNDDNLDEPRNYYNVLNITMDKIIENGIFPRQEKNFTNDGFFIIDDQKIINFKLDGNNTILNKNLVKTNFLDFAASIDFSRLGDISKENFCELNRVLYDSIVPFSISSDPGEQSSPQNIISNWKWLLKKEKTKYFFTITDFGYEFPTNDINPNADEKIGNELKKIFGDDWAGQLLPSDQFFGSGVFSLKEDPDIIRVFVKDGGTTKAEIEIGGEISHLNFFIRMVSLVYDEENNLIQNKVEVELEAGRTSGDIMDLINSETGFIGEGVKFYNSHSEYKIKFNSRFPLPAYTPDFPPINFTDSDSDFFLISKFETDYLLIKKIGGDFDFPDLNSQDNVYLLSNSSNFSGCFKSKFLTKDTFVIKQEKEDWVDIENETSSILLSSSSFSSAVQTQSINLVNGEYIIELSSEEDFTFFLGGYFTNNSLNYYLLESVDKVIIGSIRKYKLFTFDVLAGTLELATIAPTINPSSLLFNSGFIEAENFSICEKFEPEEMKFTDVYCQGLTGRISRSSETEAVITALEDRVFE